MFLGGFKTKNLVRAQAVLTSIFILAALAGTHAFAGVKTDVIKGTLYSLCGRIVRGLELWETQIQPLQLGPIPGNLLGAAILNEFREIKLEPDWLKTPLRSPRKDALILEISSLSEREREEAFSLITKLPSIGVGFKEQLKLATYDRDTWFRFLNRSLLVALSQDGFVNALVPVIQKMPEDLRQRLIGEIRLHYLDLHKLDRTLKHPTENQRLAPKRAADALLSQLAQPEHYLTSLIAQGATPLEAFDGYLTFLKTSVFKDLPVGGVSAMEILKIAEVIQSEITTGDIRSSLKYRWVRWTGSVVNGRGKPESSDIDVQISHETMTNLFSRIDTLANQILTPHFPAAKLETHAMLRTTTPHFTAQVSPLMIRITPTSIELEIYSPVRPLHQDQTMLPINYPEPRRITLQKRTLPDALEPRRYGTDKPYHSYDPLPAQPHVTQQELKEFTLRPEGERLEIPNRWLEEPAKFPQTQRLIDAALTAPDNKRPALIKNISLWDPLQDSSLKHALLLGLYDFPTWEQKISDLMKYPQSNLAVMKTIGPLAQRAHLNIQDLLIKKIHEAYPTLSKLKWERRFSTYYRKRYLELAPKRSIDVLINFLTPATEIDSKDSYQAHLKKLRSNYFYGYANGDYQIEDILAMFRLVKIHLRKWAVNNPDAPAPELLITGSVANGRASLDSTDLDIMPGQISLEKIYPDIEKDIKDYFLAKNRKTVIELHSMFATTTVANAALINPIIVKITDQKISLLVHPPISPLNGDRYQLPQNYPQPREVVLE